MSDTTANLVLPYLAAGQAQKHVTLNESLRRLDAIVQLAVVSISTTAEPGAPSDGQVYILPSGKTGTHWGGMTNWSVAFYRDGVWEEITPREGWCAFIKDTDTLKVYDGAAWQTVAGAGGYTFSATDKILGRVSSGGGAAEEVTFTDQAQQLSDDTSFSAMRTTLGAAGLADANVFTALNKFTGARTTFGANSELFSLALAFSTTRVNNNDVAYIGASDAATPDIVISNKSGAEIARFYNDRGVTLGSPTGGSKGAGTLNAVAVYDDNTLLTCGPVELLNTGGIDFEKWDKLAPDIEHPAEFEDVIELVETPEGAKVERVVGRRETKPAHVEVRTHAAMRYLAAMLDEGFDPRDPANFCARMKADGAVPGLITESEWRDCVARGEKPNIGMAVTRTFLALDNLAVAFSALVDRVDALDRSGAQAR